MRIERVELRLIEMPLVAPFETSFGVEEVEEHILVRVDGEGVTGWGECVASSGPWYSYETNQTAWHILSDYLIPTLLQDLPASPEAFSDRVARVRGHPMAKAGLEGALWDWEGKRTGESLASLFGTQKNSISVGVSVGLQPSVDSLVKRVGAYLDEGYARIKIKIKPGQDVELAKAVRSAFPDVRLQVDGNSAYRLTDLEIFRQMDPLRLLLIEQPLSNDDIYEHSILQRELATPLCLDESIHSVSDVREALALQACRIVNIKPGRVGGFTESMRIHDLCLSQGVPVWCGGMLETGIGRAGNVALAALPGFTLPGDISASRRYYSEDLVDPEFEVSREGTIRVPSRPGIGVEVRNGVVERVTRSVAEFKK